MQRIGIFCGAFDPIHLGHIRVMEDVLQRGKVDQVLIVPNGVPPYRRPVAGMEDLRRMAAIATEGMAQVSIADEEILGAGTDTLSVIRAVVRRYPGAAFSYIIGADKLAGILHWRKAAKIFELCDLIIYPRVGYNGQELALFAIAHGLKAQLLPVAPVHTSSTLVRSQLQLLSDAPGMLDVKVARYIAARGLYLPPYAERVREDMSERRYAHTLGVRDLAVELAFEHRVPMQKAAVAALLHDCAKSMKLSQLQAIAGKYRLSQDRQVLSNNALLHGLVGAKLAELKYHVQDEDVLNAIIYHTTGRSHMSPLELCIYVADAAEPGRADYPGLSEIRSLMRHDLRRAALLSMTVTQSHVQAQGLAYSPLTQQAIDDLTRSIARSKAG